MRCRPSRPKDRTQPTKLEITFGHGFDRRRYRRPKALCARAFRPSSIATEERAVLGVSGGVGRLEGHFAITLFPSRRNASKTHAPFFVTSSGVGSSTSRIAPLISTRSFFSDAYLKRPQPADPIDHVTGSISVPHDAIERLSYLV